MSWFTEQFTTIINQFTPVITEDAAVESFLREAFSGLLLNEKDLVNSSKAAISGSRLSNYKSAVLSLKKIEDQSKEFAWGLSATCTKVMEEMAKIEDVFKSMKFDDLYLLGNEKVLVKMLDQFVVKQLAMLVESKVARERETFFHKQEVMKLKHTRIIELQKILQTQQEKADVEASISIQNGIHM
jgi:hypothetical protein